MKARISLLVLFKRHKLNILGLSIPGLKLMYIKLLKIEVFFIRDKALFDYNRVRETI